MPENENPGLNEDRASRVSFGDWMHDDLTLSTFRTQFLIDACGVRTEIAAVLGRLFSGRAAMANVDLAKAFSQGRAWPITIPQHVIPWCGG